MSRSTVLTKSAISGTTPQLGTFIPLKPGGDISLQLITDGTVAGSWKVLASNKQGVDITGDNEASDITAAFTGPGTASVAVVNPSAPTTQSQVIQAGPIWAGAVTVQFTPTGGAGNTSAFLNDAS